MFAVSFENVPRPLPIDAMEGFKTVEVPKGTVPAGSFESHLRPKLPAAPPAKSDTRQSPSETPSAGREPAASAENLSPQEHDAPTELERSNQTERPPATEASQSEPSSEVEQRESGSDTAFSLASAEALAPLTLADSTPAEPLDEAAETLAQPPDANAVEASRAAEAAATVDPFMATGEPAETDSESAPTESVVRDAPRLHAQQADKGTPSTESAPLPDEPTESPEPSRQAVAASEPLAASPAPSGTTSRGREPRRESPPPSAGPESAKLIELAAAVTTESEAEVLVRRPGGEGDHAAPHQAPTAATPEAEPTNPLAAPRLAEQLLYRGAERADRGTSMTELQQARFVERVARAFQAAEGRGSPLRLRLSPPELGSLRLEIRVQGGVVNARIEADNPTARTLLLENLPALRERLEDQGVRLNQFDIDLLDRHAGGSHDTRYEQPQQPPGSRPAAAASTESEAEERHIESLAAGNQGDQTLNVVI